MSMSIRKYNIGIIGSSVTRDAFRNYYNDYEKCFNVIFTVYQGSFIEAMTEPYERNVYVDDYLKPKKVKRLNSNALKSWKKELASVEYLVIDNYADAMRGVFKSDDTDWIINDPSFRKSEQYANISNKRKLTLRDNEKAFLKLYSEKTDMFFEYLEKNYPSIRVVLNEFEPTQEYIDKDGNIKAWDSSGKLKFVKRLAGVKKLDEIIKTKGVITLNLFQKSTFYSDATHYTKRLYPIYYNKEYYTSFLTEFLKIIQVNERLKVANEEKDILESFDDVRRITSGMSDARKYRVILEEEKFFLRMYRSQKFDRKKYEIKVMNELARMGVPLAKPVNFGKNGSTVYYTTEWLKGKLLYLKIRELTSQEIYNIGMMAGKVLKLMHSLPADSREICWAVKYTDKFDSLYRLCKEMGLKFNKLDTVLDYFKKHRHLLDDRPQSFVHNDYGVHNIMISNEELAIFDFDTLGFGDPWIDFVQIIPKKDKELLGQKGATSFFATGCINGYFSDKDGIANPSEDFWKLFTLYTIVRRIQSAIRFIERKRISKDKLAELENFYSATNDMTETVPIWYQNTMEQLMKRE